MMTATKKRRRGRGERGITLLISLIVIVALLGAGATAVWLGSVNTDAAVNLNSRQAAWNAANAGIQHARQVLAAVYTAPIPTSIAAQPGGACAQAATFPYTCFLTPHGSISGPPAVTDDAPGVSNVGGKGAIFYDGATPLANAPLAIGGTTIGRYTVLIRNDPAELRGATDAAFRTDSNHTAVLRAIGTDPSGSAQVILEASVTRSLSNIPPMPNQTWGKNVDQFGSNSTMGNVAW